MPRVPKPQREFPDYPECNKSNDPKYTSRKSPPYPANRCPPGLIKQGNDGEEYITKADSNGNLRWVKHKSQQPKSQPKHVKKQQPNFILDPKINPAIRHYQDLLNETNYFKCLPLIISLFPDERQKVIAYEKALEIANSDEIIHSLPIEKWMAICFELINKFKVESKRNEFITKMFLYLLKVFHQPDELFPWLLPNLQPYGDHVFAILAQLVKDKYVDNPELVDLVASHIKNPALVFKILNKPVGKPVGKPVVKAPDIFDKDNQITVGEWNPDSGIMKYKEIRPRQVEANPEKMLKPFVGYYVSQKFDGWQVTWNGKTRTLSSHTGKIIFDAPEWWVKFLPNGYTLAGELIIPGKQAATVSALRHKNCPDWETAVFMVFDILGTTAVSFEKRTKTLEKIVKKACGSDPKCPLRYVEQFKFNTTQQLFQFYKNVVYDRLGQGIVMTKPESFYAPGCRRTGDRVKLKRREDTEGKVVGYNDDGVRLSSLLVKMDNGVVFNLGIGFSNDERIRYKQLFPIGTLIKFSYRELTDGGKPKQARFVQHRLDL